MNYILNFFNLYASGRRWKINFPNNSIHLAATRSWLSQSGDCEQILLSSFNTIRHSLSLVKIFYSMVVVRVNSWCNKPTHCMKPRALSWISWMLIIPKVVHFIELPHNTMCRSMIIFSILFLSFIRFRAVSALQTIECKQAHTLLNRTDCKIMGNRFISSIHELSLCTRNILGWTINAHIHYLVSPAECLTS